MLKAILLRKKITDAKSELATLEAKDYEARESELAKAIDEATTPDERTALLARLAEYTLETTAKR